MEHNPNMVTLDFSSPSISIFPSNTLNFNEISGYKFLKASCSYTTKMLLILENHNHRHLLQNPSKPQHRVSVQIQNNNPHIFVLEVKPCADHLDRYYVTVGVSGVLHSRKQTFTNSIPIQSSHSNSSCLGTEANEANETNEVNDEKGENGDEAALNESFQSTTDFMRDATTIEGGITFWVNDDLNTSIQLHVRAMFVEGCTYERYYSRKEAVQRGETLTGGQIRLWKARAFEDLGCSLVWKQNASFIVGNISEDNEYDVHNINNWEFNIIFPYSAIFKEEITKTSDVESENEELQHIEDTIGNHDAGEWLQNSLRNSLRRNDDDSSQNADWDLSEPYQSVSNSLPASGRAASNSKLLTTDESLSIAPQTIEYWRNCSYAHGQWMSKFKKGFCGPPSDLREFISHNV